MVWRGCTVLLDQFFTIRIYFARFTNIIASTFFNIYKIAWHAIFTVQVFLISRGWVGLLTIRRISLFFTPISWHEFKISRFTVHAIIVRTCSTIHYTACTVVT